MGYKYPKFQFEYENDRLKNVISKQNKIIVTGVVFAIIVVLIIVITFIKRENEINKPRSIEKRQQPAIAVQPQSAVTLEKHLTSAKPTSHFDETYKKPKECDNPSNDEKVVECANHYIRSKNKYESINQ